MPNYHELIEKAKSDHTGKKFLGIPEEWLNSPNWWCNNGHCSSIYIKSETGGDLCVSCHEPVKLGPDVLTINEEP